MLGAPRVKLLSFATPRFFAQQTSLNRSARKNGITDIAVWNDTELRKTAFYRAHQKILDVPKGAGLWLWKPYLICEELDRLAVGDFLVYYDVGRRWMPHTLSTPLAPLLRWCETENGGILPGVYVPEYGANMNWTKRECFVLMGCDSPTYWEHPQIQATFSVWQRLPRVVDFAAHWLDWCLKPGTLDDRVTMSDPPNFPGFRAHRHDQSIITNLALKLGVNCYGDPYRVLPRSKDINNLVDRIAGRESRIAVRNFSRKIMGRVRLAIYNNDQT
jgi:hypothetical protein